MTFGSLFAGIGGFDLGFERAGMECKWQVEINEFCRKVLAKHWPDVRRHDDIKTFPPTDAEGWRVDCICGGDPCQGNSNAGSIYKRQHEDMGSEFVRVVGALRPRVVVRENPYPSRPDALWTWWRMRAELERVGYRVLPFRLRACCVGADHRRDRVFLLGERADADGYRLERLDGQGEPPWAAGGTSRGERRRERGDGLPSPEFCRGSDGIPYRVERTRALGNAVDVRVSTWIGRRLMELGGDRP